MSDEIKSPQTPEGNDPNLTPEGTEEDGSTSPTKATPGAEGSPADKGIDYKQKFSDSKEEGIRLLHVNEELAKEKTELETKLAKASELSSEKELSNSVDDWDLLTEGEKAIARKQAKMGKELQDMKESQAWNDDLVQAKLWAKDNGYKLVGREADFKKFCYSDENRGVKNIITLAKSFLFDDKKVVKAKPKGLESPTGGEHLPVKGGKITVEEAATIRTENPRLYKKMLLEGRIKSKDIGE